MLNHLPQYAYGFDNERDARYEKFGSDFEPSQPCKACRWTTCQCGKMED